MPTFALKCDACQHAFEAFHTMKADHPPCPACGQPSRVDWTRQDAPKTVAHDLHGKRETPPDIQAQPHEVARLRKMYGRYGHCWQPNGSVRFTHKDDAKGFYAMDEQIRRKNRELKAAGKLKTKKERRAAKAGKR